MDGGSEYNNKTVDDYLDQPAVAIEKQVALMDIDFSNSMIESVFKILKYRYLYIKDPDSEKALLRVMDEAIHDYNNIRPHGCLNGLLPKEAWFGSSWTSNPFKEQLAKARKERIERNKLNTCEGC